MSLSVSHGACLHAHTLLMLITGSIICLRQCFVFIFVHCTVESNVIFVMKYLLVKMTQQSGYDWTTLASSAAPLTV